ncbi:MULTISPECIES: (Fe-S)-binding protein [unclassified Aureispira]|uniref:(Fe-S)-binding protein n=1 Tax=unclassified Aureispira TaxID=2649989 RepID=UPI0006961A60|nr:MULTISPECIES: (Fe-S)-binding protein [unclassified Aureispira]WMX16714.1 (Fe-S)-binding protein [Aureispira sp. CCB-E]
MTQTHIFVPCFIDQLYPQTAVNMVTVLKQVGCTVEYNPNQTCCGQPALNAGFWNEAYDVAKKFVADFGDKKQVVCPSASCVGFIKNHYKELLGTDVEQPILEHLQKHIYEFSEFLVEHCNIENLTVELEGRAMYHDACSALRECQIKEAPRLLLSKVKGLELLENPNSEVCCGFGGTFSAKYEPISVAMAEKKVEEALDLSAEYIISTDLSCLMHLEGYIKKKKVPLKTLHLADVLVGG